MRDVILKWLRENPDYGLVWGYGLNPLTMRHLASQHPHSAPLVGAEIKALDPQKVAHELYQMQCEGLLKAKDYSARGCTLDITYTLAPAVETVAA